MDKTLFRVYLRARHFPCIFKMLILEVSVTLSLEVTVTLGFNLCFFDNLNKLDILRCFANFYNGRSSKNGISLVRSDLLGSC